MKISEELQDLSSMLNICDKRKTVCFNEQNYEKASKYSDFCKEIIKLISFISTNADELKTEEQKKEEITKKIANEVLKSNYIMEIDPGDGE